jgi:hypothetical protein
MWRLKNHLPHDDSMYIRLAALLLGMSPETLKHSMSIAAWLIDRLGDRDKAKVAVANWYGEEARKGLAPMNLLTIVNAPNDGDAVALFDPTPGGLIFRVFILGDIIRHLGGLTRVRHFFTTIATDYDVKGYEEDADAWLVALRDYAPQVPEVAWYVFDTFNQKRQAKEVAIDGVIYDTLRGPNGPSNKLFGAVVMDGNRHGVIPASMYAHIISTQNGAAAQAAAPPVVPGVGAENLGVRPVPALPRAPKQSAAYAPASALVPSRPAQPVIWTPGVGAGNPASPANPSNPAQPGAACMPSKDGAVMMLAALRLMNIEIPTRDVRRLRIVALGLGLHEAADFFMACERHGVSVDLDMQVQAMLNSRVD